MEVSWWLMMINSDYLDDLEVSIVMGVPQALWMVFVGENPNLKWMIWRCSLFRKPPCWEDLGVFLQGYGWKQSSSKYVCSGEWPSANNSSLCHGHIYLGRMAPCCPGEIPTCSSYIAAIDFPLPGMFYWRVMVIKESHCNCLRIYELFVAGDWFSIKPSYVPVQNWCRQKTAWCLSLNVHFCTRKAKKCE